MKKIISLGVILGGVVPMFASAVLVATTSDGTIYGVLRVINTILNWIIPILITLAVVYFIWGIVKYMLGGSDEEAKKAGRAMIINGLIGLFIILAFWGIVSLVMNTFGIYGSQLDPNKIPCIQGPGVDCEL